MNLTVKRKQNPMYLVFAIFAVVAVWGCIRYAKYIQICGYRIPIMDYFRWISFYGPRLHEGSISFSSFFTDTNEQVQPGILALTFLVLEKSRYDIWAMMVIGIIFLCIQATTLSAFVLLMCRKKAEYRWYGLLSAVAFFLLRLNLNQWELYSEPFEMGTAIRLLLFFSLFIYTEYLFKRIFDFSLSKQVVSILLFSLIAASVSLFFSAAYFVGLLGAISLAGVLMLANRRKDIRLKHWIWISIWGLTVLVVLAVYISAMPPSAMQVSASDNTLPITRIWGFLESIILFFGASIVPQKLSEQSADLFLVVGTIIVVVGIYLTFAYFASKTYKKSMLPFILVLYSVIICIIIEIGRGEAYGVYTMLSSRYCVESIIGVCGMVLMALQLCLNGGDHAHKYRILSVIISSAAIIGTLFCNSTEMRMAPYRAEYQEAIKNIMLNIDDVGDEALGICQAEPMYVRDSVAFLRENKFSVFQENE